MRVVLTGGGTGGHIYPGLTLLQHIRQLQDDAEFLYIGYQRGLERDIVARQAVPIKFIDAAQLRRRLSPAIWHTVVANYRGYRQARRLLRHFRPHVVVGTGGFVTLPVVYAAHRLGIPSVIWEANALPGLTNRLCARFAQAVAVSFPGTEGAFPQAKRVVCTGNPRASEVTRVPAPRQAEARQAYGLDARRRLILFFAGSRGAETVNEVMIDLCRRVPSRPDWQLLYVTGDAHYQPIRSRIGDIADNVRVLPFIHDMPAVMPQADVVITRAGGATLAEIASLSMPAILIPSPYVTANHQEQNARRYTDVGAARLLLEADLTADALWRELELVLDTGKGPVLRAAVGKLATPNAAADLYRLVLDVMRS